MFAYFSQLQLHIMLEFSKKKLQNFKEAKNIIVKTLGCSNLRISIVLALRAYIS